MMRLTNSLQVTLPKNKSTYMKTPMAMAMLSALMMVTTDKMLWAARFNIDSDALLKLNASIVGLSLPAISNYTKQLTD